jgi:hypothetical protein
VAISHLTSDFAPAAVASGVAAYNEAVPGGITARSHAGVTALLGGLSLVPPGVVPVSEWRPDPGTVRQPADLYAALAATHPVAHQFDLYPVGSEPIMESPIGDPPRPLSAGPEPPALGAGSTARPRPTDQQPDPDPDACLQRMLIITGLLTAAGLTACLNVTRDIPDVTAWLPQPGGRDIKIIIDDDGYVELRFWVSPGTSPERVTTIVTGAIATLAASG